MKIKNISKEEQKICPPLGASCACAPGESIEVHPVVGADLLSSFPSVWESADVHPKKKKAGEK